MGSTGLGNIATKKHLCKLILLKFRVRRTIYQASKTIYFFFYFKGFLSGILRFGLTYVDSPKKKRAAQTIYQASKIGNCAASRERDVFRSRFKRKWLFGFTLILTRKKPRSTKIGAILSSTSVWVLKGSKKT